MNNLILQGRLTRDPETKTTATAVIVTKFGLAVPRKFKKDNEPDCDFINCVAFGKTAETIQKFVVKGQQIAIQGRLQTGSYEKDGVKVYTADCVVENFYFCGSKAEKTNDFRQDFVSSATVVEDDSDLPF